MSPKYLLLLALIRSGVRTFRQLDAAIGATPSYSRRRVSRYLDRLKDWDLITWEPEIRSTVRLTEAGQKRANGLILARRGEQITGLWEVNEAATAHAIAPLIDEAEALRLAVVEYEELAS